MKINTLSKNYKHKNGKIKLFYQPQTGKQVGCFSNM